MNVTLKQPRLVYAALVAFAITAITSCSRSAVSSLIHEVASLEFDDPVYAVYVGTSDNDIAVVTFRRNSEPVFGPARISTSLYTREDNASKKSFLKCSFPGHQIRCADLASNTLAVGVSDGSLLLWRDTLADGWSVFGEYFTACSLSANGQSVAMADWLDPEHATEEKSAYSKVILVDSLGESSYRRFSSMVKVLALNPNATQLAVGAKPSGVEVLALPTWSNSFTASSVDRDGLAVTIQSATWCPDGSRLLVAGTGGFGVWHSIEHKQLCNVAIDHAEVVSASFPDNRYVVIAQKTTPSDVRKPSTFKVTKWKLTQGAVELVAMTDIQAIVLSLARNGRTLAYVAPDQPNVVRVSRVED